MKKMKSVFIAVALMLGVAQFANAQKVAHIDVRELMENHPDLLKAQKQLETIAESYDKDYRGLVTEFTNKRDQYMAEETTVSDAVNQERAIELQNMQRSIQEFMNGAQTKLGEKEEELSRPIMDKVRNAIQKVAREKGYEYVFDSTLGASNLLLAEGPDLLADVKKELGL